MRKLINFTCIAMYTIVMYFTINFLIKSFTDIDSILRFIEVLFTSVIITITATLVGYFCYKIIREKDTE